MTQNTAIALTPGQEAGYKTFMQFYANPLETVMLLKGYSGTGKSTLVRKLIEDLPKYAEMCRMVAPNWVEPEIVLSATTNQAAEALAEATGFIKDTATIHKVLSLRVAVTDYKKQTKELVAYGDAVTNKLIFIDEASYIDQSLLTKIFEQTDRCKLVFIGDPAQLTPVKSHYMPAFNLNNITIELTDLVRFAKGPMTDIVTNMRETVLTGKWHKFKLHPGILDHVDQEAFDRAALKLFSDPKKYGRVKILAYTNDRVMHYNKMLADALLGTPDPQEGMRMMVNEAVNNSASRCTTNEEVTVESVREGTDYMTEGWYVTLRGKGSEYFMPKFRQDKAKAHRIAAAEDDYQAMKIIVDSWIDLRPAFACTVNKSQGSTYDIVLVDLSDICGRMHVVNQMARALYVGISRARSRVIFTGDIRRK